MSLFKKVFSALLLALPCLGYAQTFTQEPGDLLPAPYPGGHYEWADLDADNDLDALHLGLGNGYPNEAFLKVYENKGSSYAEVTDAFGTPVPFPRSYALGDGDRDGDLDLMLVVRDTLRWARNDGNRTFSVMPVPGMPEATSGAPLHWLDVDGDGDPDLVVAGRLYLNEGGTYTPSLHKVFPMAHVLSWADVNNDGLPDFIGYETRTYTYQTFLYLNQGGGLFKPSAAPFSPANDEYAKIRWLDADADRDVDLFLTEKDGKCTLFKNTLAETGAAGLKRAHDFPSLRYQQVEVGDVDLNGLPDFVFSGELSGLWQYETQVYLNQSTRDSLRFEPAASWRSDLETHHLSLHDADGDEDLDLLIAGNDRSTYTRRLVLYRNTVASPAAKPLPPTGPVARVEEAVVLSWRPGAATGAVSYNLDLRRDGKPFVTPFSRENGSRTWPRQPGNPLAAEAYLRNLPAGNYTWRVQAVDAGRRASAFSPFSSFVVAAPPGNLTVQQPALTRVVLGWTDNAAGESGYAVFRRATHEAYEKMATLPAGTTAYTDTTLQANQDYAYHVKAVYGETLSAPGNPVAVSTPLFAEDTLSVPANPAAIEVGVADLDGDNDLDLGLRTGYSHYAGSILLLGNDGKGTYAADGTQLPRSENNYGFRHMLIRDVDRDGDQDVCAVEDASSHQKIVFFRNDGGAFTRAYESESVQYVQQVTLEDFNHDGLPDLLAWVTPGHGKFNGYRLLWQKSPFSFTDSRIRFIPERGQPIGQFAVGDLDDDGFADILFGGGESGKPTLFKNLGGSSFRVEATNLPELGVYPITLLDYNGDGHLDVLNVRYHNAILAHAGDGKFAFGAPRPLETPFSNVQATGLQAADFDLDGRPDLLITYERGVVLLQNRGPGEYVPAQYPFAEAMNARAAISDFENDGDLDIIQMGAPGFYAAEGQSLRYENKRVDGTVTNAPPTPPTHVRVDQQQGLTLWWDPATDDRTPAAGLSYNLHLADAQGNIFFHAETDASGLFRRRLAPGNLGTGTQYVINDLPAGRYTARLQALDAAYRPSACTEGLVFDVLAGPTALTLHRVLLNKVTLRWTDGLAGESTVRVERRTLTSDYETVAELPADATTFTDSLLAYNQVYLYRVRAEVSGRRTAASNVAEWNTSLLAGNKDTRLPKLNTATVDVGDYNNDGRMDLAVSGHLFENETYVGRLNAVVENTGTDWVQHPAGAPTTINYRMNFYDFDGDHRLDLLQHGFIDVGSYASHVFLNQGGHRFGETASAFTLSPQSQELLTWWDYDSDNDLDAYVHEWGDHASWKRKLLRNDGAGRFAVAELTHPCAGCPQEFIPGDFDGDGDEDLIRYDIPEWPLRNGYYLLRNEEGKMTDGGMVLEYRRGQVRTLDYNGDGRLDLFFLEGDFESRTGVLYKNLGPDAEGVPRFADIKTWLPMNREVEIDWADYDHDGDLDFFATGYEVVVYHNDGDDRFSAHKIPELYLSYVKSRWIDFDNDGDLDLYMAGNPGDYPRPDGTVLVNQLIVDGKGVRNQPPAPPAGLSARQDAEGLRLTWQPATDDHTPEAAITYDVILYKDGKAVTKAAIDPVTGNRQKLAFGRSPRQALLRNLPLGSYAWKVQAVDQTFAGSALSATGTFTYRPAAPMVRDTTIYRCGRTVRLTAEGENINWYGDEAGKNKLASGIFQPTASAVVYVTQTVDGVEGVPRKVTITVYDKPEKPVVAGANPVLYCENGSTVFLEATGTDLKWYSDATLKNGAGTGPSLAAPAAATSYYVTQTLDGCESAPAEVVLKPLPLDARIYFRNGSLVARERDGDYYEWFRDGRPIGAGREIRLAGPGKYEVVIRKRNCWKTSPPYTATDDPEQLQAFPNPTRGDFNVQIPTGGTRVEIRIYNNLGTLVYQAILSDAKQNVAKIPAATWPKGVYQVHVWEDGTLASKKRVVIQ